MHHAIILAKTKPEEDMTMEEFVIFAARNSNPANQYNHASSPKLVEYLISHNHWSPFEMASITMEIITTRDIARQMLRHRSFSFQEFSQRYADPTQVLGFCHREARLQDKKNRQNSLPTEDQALIAKWAKMQSEVMDQAQHVYEKAISMGIAKEQARAVLPEGLTVSRLYMAGTIRSWIHYSRIRTKLDTQAEHRTIADSAWQNVVAAMPSLKDAL
jgi:thymidylate synthase (FAD)